MVSHPIETPLLCKNCSSIKIIDIIQFLSLPLPDTNGLPLVGKLRWTSVVKRTDGVAWGSAVEPLSASSRGFVGIKARNLADLLKELISLHQECGLNVFKLRGLMILFSKTVRALHLTIFSSIYPDIPLSCGNCGSNTSWPKLEVKSVARIRSFGIHYNRYWLIIKSKLEWMSDKNSALLTVISSVGSANDRRISSWASSNWERIG